MADAVSVDSEQAETRKNYVNEELDHLKKVDGILIDGIARQFGVTYVDPVTELNEFSRGFKYPYSEPQEAIRLRIAQSAYIDQIQQEGINVKALKIDPNTGKRLDLRSRPGFQRWYELVRSSVVIECAKIKSKLIEEGKFIPEIDVMSGEMLANDSLKLVHVLKGQEGTESLTKEEFEIWQVSFHDILNQYKQITNLRSLIQHYQETYYMRELKWQLQGTLIDLKAQVIKEVNYLLKLTGISVPEPQSSYDKGNIRFKFELVPQTIEQGIAYYESKGLYIPPYNPDSIDHEAYPKGSLDRLLLARDIFLGKRGDILLRRQEELRLIEEEKQKQAELLKQAKLEKFRAQREYIKQRRIEGRIGSVKVQEKLKQLSDLPVIQEKPKGFWEKLLRKKPKDFLREWSNIDQLKFNLEAGIDFYKEVYYTLTLQREVFLAERRNKYQSIIQKYGLDPEMMLSSWYSVSNQQPIEIYSLINVVRLPFELLDRLWGFFKSGSYPEAIVFQNIQSLQNLERQRPGIAQTLFKEFGITNYTRYPKSLLVGQYDNRQRQDLPYIVINYPREDWNGAYTSTKLMGNSSGLMSTRLEQFSKQTKGKILIRFTETGSVRDLAELFLSLHRRYQKKISAILLAGHGSPNSLQLGDLGRSPIIYKKYLEGAGAKELRDFIEEDGTVILESCSTGKEGGLAQKLSEKLPSLTVIAPDSPTICSDLKLSIKEGRVKIKANFPKLIGVLIIPFASSSLVYQAGKLTQN